MLTTDTEKQIFELADDMRVHGAIVILGAGSSFEVGMPLYAQFYPIIWQILDSYPDLKSKMGFDPLINAKSQLVDDKNQLKHFFDYLEDNLSALQEFKRIFKVINDRQSNTASQSHIFLAKLIHSGLVKLVIS